MPPIPHTSPLTGLPVHPSFIHTSHLNFIDNNGRTLLLRGVNLSGASKAPHGQLSYEHDDFWEQAERGDVSFVGRPLRLEDGSADVHLARLRGWGFNLLRVPFVWEALEHEGPGKYDYEYMDYLIQVLSKCREYGFKVYMDPHQDCWSRFSGGSGAPFWTLPACSINHLSISATQAAILHSEYPYAHAPDPHSLPAMIWSTNYGRLLSQTVFTLFFAGRDFAPLCIIDGVNIQDWLQGHFFRACSALAERIASYEGGSLFESCIIGWDSLNEPFEGLVGWDDISLNPTAQGSTLKKGTHPTPAQSMRLGMGQLQKVEHYTFSSLGPKRDGWVDVDPKGWKVWASAEELGEVDGVNERWGWTRGEEWSKEIQEEGRCVWAMHGVWDVETGFVLRGDYFKYRPERSNSNPEDVDMVQVEFLEDYYKPFYLSYLSTIRPHHPESIIFIQPPVFAPPPSFSASELRGRAAYSPHYYDGLTLVTRHWNWFNADALGLLRGRYDDKVGGKARAVKLGEGQIRRSLREQIGYLCDDVGVLGVESLPEDGDDEGDEGREDGENGEDTLSRSTATYPGTLPGHLSLAAAATPSTKLAAKKPTLPTTGAFPTLLGEIGTPFDMDGKRSYGYGDDGLPPDDGDDKGGKGGKNKKYIGDYSKQEKALDASLNGCDGGVSYLSPRTGLSAGEEITEDTEKRAATERPVNYTIWTYVPDDHTWEWGDGWNGEDLSLWSWGDWVDEFSSAGSHLGGAKQKIVEEEEGLDSRAGLLTATADSTARTKTTQPRPRLDMRPKEASQMSLDTLAFSGDGRTVNVDAGAEAGNGSVVKTKRSSATIASSLSASSSTSSGSALSKSLVKPSPRLSTPTHPRGFNINPYTFLTNGSRAVRAFSRPWPQKVVGQATKVEFELEKGVFKLGVQVKGDDWVPYGRDKLGNEEDEWDESRATEVYLPLVHYASRELVDDALRRWGRTGDHQECEEGRETGMETTRSTDSNETDSSTVVVDVDGDHTVESDKKRKPERHEQAKLLIRDTYTYTPLAPTTAPSSKAGSPSASAAPSAASSSLNLTHSSINLGASSSTTSLSSKTIPLIDVEVKISTGRYKIKGQRLLWWYDLPTSPDQEVTVELEVRRKGGPLKGVVDWRKVSDPRGKANGARRERARVLGVRDRSWDAQGGEGGQGGWIGHAWCEKMCDAEGGCLVM